MWMTLATFIVGTAVSSPTAVVGIDEGPTLAASLARVIATEREAGSEVLTGEQLLERLAPTAGPRQPDVEALERMLADARDREARFDSAGASALRTELLGVFDRAPRVDDSLRRIAAAAAHDATAALLAEGDATAAAETAREALRRFGSVPLDAARHPPTVQALFAAAQSALAEGPTGALTITSDVGGTVWADGTRVGEINGTLRTRLPHGNYRLWIEMGSGMTSLPHAIQVGETDVTLVVQAELEAIVELEPVIRLRCDATCETPLRRLGALLGVARIVGVHADESAGAIAVTVAGGEAMPWSAAAAADVADAADPRARFSPLYLLPFGGGQFAQRRPIFAGAYAAVQVGLAGWHVVSWRRHSTAVADADYAREPDLRSRRNLTAALFYGSIAANIVEALLVGWFTGEP